jgi:hypothetical protein
VLAQVDRPIVVFVDEIDATLSLPFSRGDFFTAVRALHLRRLERAESARLTFCLLGVAAPGDLVEDPTRTLLNVGRSIWLEDFKREEAAALREGFEGVVPDPDALLDAIFAWTSGRPYMTLRLCEDLTGVRWGQAVDEAVRERFLERSRTEDPNLQHAARWFEEARAGAKAGRARDAPGAVSPLRPSPPARYRGHAAPP